MSSENTFSLGVSYLLYSYPQENKSWLCPLYCKRRFLILGSRSKIILYINLLINPSRKASKCTVAEGALNQKVENWNLTAPARPSFSLKKSHIMEFPFLLAGRKAVTYKYACEDTEKKIKETCTKHSAQNFPATQRSWKTASFQNFFNTSWIFLSPLSISWETLPMDKNTKMSGLCV